jgi:GTP cyclohydrolase I
MSRIMRTLYEDSNELFSPEVLVRILRSYRRDLDRPDRPDRLDRLDSLDSLDAQVTLRFSYPIRNGSLRSGLLGYQYYEVAMEARMDREGDVRTYLHLDYVYSSTCPCSYELSQHAIATRGVAAVPHSQRSVARVTVELEGPLAIEELRDLCLAALQTETQVMVKREDEQAFAELNAAYLKFVEDAVRLLYEKLDGHAAIRDFRVLASHQESLHSHDAVSVVVKGMPGGLRAEVAPGELATLIHR